MRINYDKSADAIYIRMKATKVKKTLKIQDGLLADVNRTGNVCGVEILNVSHWLPKRDRRIEIGKQKVSLPAFV